MFELISKKKNYKELAKKKISNIKNFTFFVGGYLKKILISTFYITQSNTQIYFGLYLFSKELFSCMTDLDVAFQIALMILIFCFKSLHLSLKCWSYVIDYLWWTFVNILVMRIDFVSPTCWYVTLFFRLFFTISTENTMLGLALEG